MRTLFLLYSLQLPLHPDQHVRPGLVWLQLSSLHYYSAATLPIISTNLPPFLVHEHGQSNTFLSGPSLLINRSRYSVAARVVRTFSMVMLPLLSMTTGFIRNRLPRPATRPGILPLRRKYSMVSSAANVYVLAALFDQHFNYGIHRSSSLNCPGSHNSHQEAQVYSESNGLLVIFV